MGLFRDRRADRARTARITTQLREQRMNSGDNEFLAAIKRAECAYSAAGAAQAAERAIHDAHLEELRVQLVAAYKSGDRFTQRRLTRERDTYREEADRRIAPLTRKLNKTADALNAARRRLDQYARQSMREHRA